LAAELDLKPLIADLEEVQELTDSLQIAFWFRTVFEPADMAIEVVLELLLRWKADLEAY
jgi:hypothetical protein